MANLPEDITSIINVLKQQALDILKEATAAEMMLFERFGETTETTPYLDELQNVIDDAESTFNQLSTIQVQIAKSQPVASRALLELMSRSIERTQVRVPAWKRSLEEVKQQWSLL